MLRYNRKNKNLKIPVGIGTNNNVDSSLLFNVSDGDATAGDLIAGKTAYSAEGFIVGTLDVETEIQNSYNEGYSAGEQDGYVSGEADGYADGYSEGKEDGIEEILTEQSDANITSGSVLEGYIGYGANNERIVGTNVGGFDFGEIGYTEEESNKLNLQLKEPIEYTKSLMPIEPSTNMNRKFSDNTNLIYAPYIDTSITKDMGYMFNNCRNLTVVPLFDTSSVTNMSYMFKGCISLTTVPLFDTSNVTNMGYMFQDCNSLKVVPLFDTSKVKDMSYMFQACPLTTVPLFNTSSVTSMYRMFYSCTSLTTVPLFDTSNVTDFSYMFCFCDLLSGPAPNFNMSNAKNVRNMFMNTKITSIYEYDLSQVETLGPFLYGCSLLKTCPNLNTQNATNYSETFANCRTLESIGNLDMSNATETNNTFGNCNSLTTIGKVKDCGKGYTNNVNSSYQNLNFVSCPLDKESCLNVINSVYDMNLRTDYNRTPILMFSSTSKALLSDEDIAIATNKGWTIQ